MKWDKKGAIKALDAKKCFVCESVKPVHVVATVHGKQDLHFPCCSDKCLENFSIMCMQILAEKR